MASSSLIVTSEQLDVGGGGAHAVPKGFPLVTNIVMLRQGESRRGFESVR